MSPVRRISTSWAIALVGLVFIGLGAWRVLIDSSRSPVLAFGFGVVFVLLGAAGVVRARVRRSGHRDL